MSAASLQTQMTDTQPQHSTQPMERSEKLEQIFAAAYLDRELYHRDHELKIHWPANLTLTAEIALRFQTPQGRIYGELQPFPVRAGAVANLGKVYRVPDGVYQVLLLPRLEEYYEQGLKIERRIDLQVANGSYSTTPANLNEPRRQEALDEAARRNLHLFSEIAKMMLDRWAQVKPAVIQQAITSVKQRAADSALYRLGLIGLAARFGADPRFPADLLPALEDAILNFDDGTDNILSHVAEILVGQLYPDQHFAHSGQNGAWHQAQGEARVLAWLQQRAHRGFPAWEISTEIESTVLALTHLVDWAANDKVAELAAVLLDKLFFTLAVNSYQGTFGLAGPNGRLAATTALARLLWGTGAWNNQIIGASSLAASGYELPPIIAQIAADQPTALWSRACHPGDREINQVAYKTPDYLLCSVQDYRPGEPGTQEQLWQATLGPDAVVFVNHPAAADEQPTQPPAGWRGNGLLPRVAQWQEVLVAIHKLPTTDAVGFTHAYFPTTAFDEYALHDGWAFARLGNGYLALRASGAMQFATSGAGAGRELRVDGTEQSWFLHLGRAAQDGSFADFQASICALNLQLEPLALHATTLRGETIDFGWQGPLLVNGVAQPITGFKQEDNPYCVADLGAEQMEIRLGDQVLRLDFSMERDFPAE